ncbi:thioesterase II family protein [Saccharopolyspora spinosa]|uniref:Surfactin synthase thioesterase subunit n=1 Tax=Saccharopolyspora spinosa TaxID=60894 RepID=A0A2N3XZC0_SACSN|nr:alpha/beta fold hydrolase [Saccharopolyspora spinosa]PKW16027.1 surfactin synthase thioesterase subunit [Saccharopolyspora spinosa]
MTNREDSPWIRRFHPKPTAGNRLVCFPHAGGSASYFHPVSAAMPPSVEVLAIQYPGRQDRRQDPLVDDLTVLADTVTTVLLDWTDRPLTFFGHSMGATLAFEVARRLERIGVVTAGLFASGRRAPSCHREEAMHRSSDQELLREVMGLGGTESQLIDDEITRMILPSLRNDYRAVETYRYEPGSDVTCPVIAFIGDADPKVTPSEAQAWAGHTTGEFVLQIFPGGHFYLNEHKSVIVNAISDHILKAGAKS